MFKLAFFFVVLGVTSAQLLNFTVVGDFGLVQDLSYADKLFTAINDHTAAGHPFSFFVTVGDNIYPSGITDTNDPDLRNTLKQLLYQKPELQNIPMYATLGNHDCEGNAQAMQNYITDNWIMNQDYWTTYFNQEGVEGSEDDDNLVGIVFMNGCKLVCLQNAGQGYCEVMHIHTKQEVEAHYTWLESEIPSVRAHSRWMFTVNHYPLHSVDSSGDRGDITPKLLPLLEKNKLDVFLMGHSHDMQYLVYNLGQKDRLRSLSTDDMQCQMNTEILYQNSRIHEWKKGEQIHQVLSGASGMPPEGEEQMSAVCKNPNTVAEPWYAFNAKRAYTRVEVWEDKLEIIYLDDENIELFRGRIVA